MQTRYFLYTIGSFIFINLANGQSNKPDEVHQVPNANKNAVTRTDYDNDITVNYVLSKEAIGKYSNVSTFDAAGYNDVKQTTQYFDGLGRPLETVMRQATTGNNPHDLVSPVLYDAFGRETYKYLPYVQ